MPVYLYTSIFDNWLFEDGSAILLEDGSNMVLEEGGEEYIVSYFTLFDLTYQVARNLDIVLEGTATGGSTTTVADTADRTEEDDYFNGGTVWILRDAGGAGAAPELQFSAVSDFANSGGVISLRTTLTAAVASGDKYGVATDRFPLWVIIQKLNDALPETPLIITDTTTITTALDQTEYNLPAVANLDLLEVWMQTDTTDETDDNQWVKLYNWRVHYTATGTADKLILPMQYSAGYDLKLVYTGFHPELHAYNDKLSEVVRPDVLVNLATLKCLEWYRNKTQDNDQWILDKIAKFVQKVDQDAAQKRLQAPGRTRRIIQSGPQVPGYETDLSEINRVRL